MSRDTSAASTQAKALVDAVNSDPGRHHETRRSTTPPPRRPARWPATRPSARPGHVAARTRSTPATAPRIADIGIETDRYGKLVFNEEKFAEAYAADAAAVTEKLSGATGLAARIEKVANAASDKYEGSITTSITSRTTGIDRLNDSIEAWDQRLELRRASLTRQFTALETALSQMNSQSSWLSGQVGTALSNSSGS